MTNEERREVIEALKKFVLRVADPIATKKPGESEALPAVVEILFKQPIVSSKTS